MDLSEDFFRVFEKKGAMQILVYLHLIKQEKEQDKTIISHLLHTHQIKVSQSSLYSSVEVLTSAGLITSTKDYSNHFLSLTKKGRIIADNILSLMNTYMTLQET